MGYFPKEFRDIDCCSAVGQIQCLVQLADRGQSPLNTVECRTGFGRLLFAYLNSDQRFERLKGVFDAVIHFFAQDLGIGQGFAQFDPLSAVRGSAAVSCISR